MQRILEYLLVLCVLLVPLSVSGQQNSNRTHQNKKKVYNPSKTKSKSNTNSFENDLGNEKSFSTCYIGIPKENYVNNLGKIESPGTWTVKIVNDNGNERIYNLEPNYISSESTPLPESALEKDLRDLYYVKINVPAVLQGSNTIYLSTSLLDRTNSYEAKNGGTALITFVPPAQIKVFFAFDLNEADNSTGKVFNEKNCDIKITNENGKSLVLTNVPLVGLDSPKRRLLSSSLRKDLQNNIYASVVLPESFEGDNTLVISTRNGKWTRKLEDAESNTSVIQYLYLSNIEK